MPTDSTDMAAMIHDIEYLGLKNSLADANAIKNAPWTGKLMMYPGFALNRFIGYGNDKDEDLYQHLKGKVYDNPQYVEIMRRTGATFLNEETPKYPILPDLSDC